MSDKITCPWCEKSFDVDQVEMAELWAERTQLAARLGQAWKLANEYCDSFRSARNARITLKRRVAILTDIARLWEVCVIEYDGKRYKTDQRSIQEALHAVCSADKTGFTNHNYLKRVLLNPAQPARQAKLLSSEGLTAEEEENREQSRRSGNRDALAFPQLAAEPPSGNREPETGNREPPLTPAQIEEHRRKLAGIVAKLGRHL